MSTFRLTREILCDLRRLGSYRRVWYTEAPIERVRSAVSGHNARSKDGRKYKVVEAVNSSMIVLVSDGKRKFDGVLGFDGQLYRGNIVDV